MFKDSKKEKQQSVESSGNQNIIAQGTKIVGDLSSEGGFRIDGEIEGNLKTPGKVVVGKTGFINGTLEGTDAYFEGRFTGKLQLSGTLTLKSTANIQGDVVVAKLAVDPGANFDVTCIMKSGVKAMKNDRSKEKTA
ncbi:polymer-forming cytoskeletal protein [Formosa sediminum]|uniref:Polymer-forming cytoskeletal protein n=1 Tax=Formosa sediminum TaxID=2594004 RepID=A0A516GP45_9FLAO|nr:polymer-forming cytoskeletal protein [Formosa sediminum]QDO93130.1 polymer-forming cytoskeletal protein [Formosa sediminum]